MSLIPPKPLCAGGKRVPALPVSAVPVSPVAGSKSATLQAASSAMRVMVRLFFLIPCIVRTGLAGCLLVYRTVLRCSAVFIPAPLFAVEVWFRTSLCGHVFSGSRSPVATCHRAALLIGLPLCLQRSGYLSRFACAGLSPVGATQHLARVEGLDPSSCGFGGRSSALNYPRIKGAAVARVALFVGQK